MDSKWTERNGETTPPELGDRLFAWFWFDGIAGYDDWTGRGNLVTVTATHTDRVMGLVFIMLTADMKHPKKDAQGRFIRDQPTVIAIPETMGYELGRCVGKWYGPVDVPEWDDQFMPTLATVMEYVPEEWETDTEANDA